MKKKKNSQKFFRYQRTKKHAHERPPARLAGSARFCLDDKFWDLQPALKVLSLFFATGCCLQTFLSLAPPKLHCNQSVMDYSKLAGETKTKFDPPRYFCVHAVRTLATLITLYVLVKHIIN
jgi:hypothetical protein